MKVYIFNEKISLVSSSRLAGEKNIKEILGIKTIPESMRPLLKQEVIPKWALAPLAKYRAQARALIMSLAVRDDFFGWIIDPSKKETLEDGLTKIKECFYGEKQILVEGYDSLIEDHLSSLRESCEKEGLTDCDAFVDAIRRSQPPKEYLESKIRFEFLSPKLVDISPEAVS